MGIRAAGFWTRAIAFSIDLVLINLLFILLSGMGHLGMQAALKTASLPEPSRDLLRYTENLYVTVYILLFWGYFVFFQANGGQTPAKRYLRIRIVSTDRTELDWRTSSLRALSYFISGPLLLGLGFLMIAFHPHKRGLHDLVAGTLVVHETAT